MSAPAAASAGGSNAAASEPPPYKKGAVRYRNNANAPVGYVQDYVQDYVHDTVPPIVDAKLVPYAKLAYLREYVPAALTSVVGRFVGKFDASLRSGLAVVSSKIDDFRRAVDAAGNQCDEPLDKDVRRLELERGRVRLLNALRRARPDLLARLADAGARVGEVDPRRGADVGDAWLPLFKGVMQDLGESLDGVAIQLPPRPAQAPPPPPDGQQEGEGGEGGEEDGGGGEEEGGD